MATADIIKTQYMLFETDDVPTVKSESEEVLDLFISDMDNSIRTSSAAVNQNLRDKQLTKIKNFFYGLLGYEEEDTDYFEEDTEILFRHGCLAERYKEYFSKIKNILSDDNYLEIYKLSMFTYNIYSNNYSYLESLRDSAVFARQGIIYYGLGEDTQGEFQSFFDEVYTGLVESKKTYIK